MPVTDAVVIGSGPNGLVAANLLADRGWEVTVLEAQNAPGGAVRSDSEVHPGFVHDTFSSFYPLAAVSPTIRGLHLEGFGLHWEHAPAVAGTPFLSGEWALMHRTPEATAEALDAMAPGDGPRGSSCARGGSASATPCCEASSSPFRRCVQDWGSRPGCRERVASASSR